MFKALQNLFTRKAKHDPLHEQRQRLLALSKSGTVESARHRGMEAADINILLRAIVPDHAQGHVGASPLKPGMKPKTYWLRAEPNIQSDKTPMMLRIFMISTADGADSRNAHIVMVSNNKLAKPDVERLFVMWDEEAARIAALPPPVPEQKQEQKPDPAPDAPVP